MTRSSFLGLLGTDHGVGPLPERLKAQGIEVGRLSPSPVVAAAEETLSAVLGPAKYVAAYEHTELYFAPALAAKVRASAPALAALRDRVKKLPGVLDVFSYEDIPGRRDPLADLYTHSYVPGRSGDLTVVYRPYWIDSPHGTSHGSPFEYDTHVPVALMGKGIMPGEYLSAASPIDIAPTLAFLTGITLPRAEGRVLTEAIK